MIRNRTAGRSTRTPRARRARRRNFAVGVGLLAAIACGGAAWQCEVTMELNGQTVTGKGSGSRRALAVAEARRAACEQLGLEGTELTRCEQGLNPGDGSWNITEDCTET